MIIFYYLYSIILIGLLSALFTALGYSFLSACDFLEKDDDFYFTVGTSFFTGSGIILSVWSLLAHVFQSASAMLYITLGASIVTILLYKKAIAYFKDNLISLRKITITVLIFVALGILGALVPMPESYITQPMSSLNPFDGVHTVAHSFRSGNIAEYLVQTNNFPRFSQNSGQAVLAAMPLFLGDKGTQLSLVLWLNIFIAFFALFSYGFTKKYFMTGKLALLPVLIILVGNTVLSPIYSRITDIGSTILLMENYEGLFGIATFLLCLIVLYKVLHEKKNSNSLLWIFVLNTFVWNITSGHMTLLLMFILCCLAILHRKTFSWKCFAKIAISCVLAASVGMLIQGGMLYPSKNLQQPQINGLMVVNDGTKTFLKLRFPWAIEPNINPHQERSTKSLKDTIKDNKEIYNIIQSIRFFAVIFFPILGLALYSWLLYVKKIGRSQFQVYFLTTTVALFIIGVVISNFIVLYGSTWELTRFLYYGVFAAMYLLGISLAMLMKGYDERGDKKKKILLTALAFFIALGPTLSYFVNDIGSNIFTSLPPQGERILTLSERLSALVTIK